MDPNLGTKPWWTSTAMWGGIIALIGGIVSSMGYAFGGEDAAWYTDQTVQGASALATLIGSLTAIYGRAKATKRIAPGSSLPVLLIALLPTLALSGCAATAQARYYQQVSAANTARSAVLVYHEAGEISDAKLIELDAYEKAWRAALVTVKQRLDAGGTPPGTLDAMLDTADAVASDLITFLKQLPGEEVDDGTPNDPGGADAGAGGDPVGPAAVGTGRRADRPGQTEWTAHARTDRPDRAPAARDRAAVGRRGGGCPGAYRTAHTHTPGAAC